MRYTFLTHQPLATTVSPNPTPPTPWSRQSEFLASGCVRAEGSRNRSESLEHRREHLSSSVSSRGGGGMKALPPARHANLKLLPRLSRAGLANAGKI